MDKQYYKNKIDQFINEIKIIDGNFSLEDIELQKSIIRDILNNVNSKSNDFIILGAILPRVVLVMLAFSFAFLSKEYESGKINDETWNDIMDTVIDGFGALYNSPVFFDQEKISEARLHDNQVYLMLNSITMEQYFLISGTLIMLLSAGIYVFGEKFEDIDILQKYIFSCAKEVLDFDAKVKVLV